MIFPVGISNEEVYAETIEYPAGENNNVATISFVLNDKDIDGSEVSTEVVQDEVGYISNTLKVTTNNIGKFAIVIQSASDNGNLVNSENGATIAPISNATTPSNFANNTWGYALSDETSKTNAELTYNPLPAFQEEPTAQYTKSEPDDGIYNLKLVFAAKIGSNKPAGHYKTTALVSVVAEAKELIKTLSSITYMQDMTSDICSHSAVNETKQLVDNRETTKSYQVTKLKGNVGCWMMENMDYDGGLRMTHRDIYGGYYNWTNAKTVCSFTGWTLPLQAQYQNLINTYNASSNGTVLTQSPLNFLFGDISRGDPGTTGYYWSSTPDSQVSGLARSLTISGSYAGVDYNDKSDGLSVRCVAQ